MATRLWGTTPNEAPHEVSEAVGSAVAADSVELTVDLADNLTKLQVLHSLEKIRRAIVESPWPPA